MGSEFTYRHSTANWQGRQASDRGSLPSPRAKRGELWTLSTRTGYNERTSRFTDLATCVYDWFGECGRERQLPGELAATSNGTDQRRYQDYIFNRTLLSFHPSEAITLRVTAAPTHVRQTGEDVRITDPEVRDPLKMDRDLFTWINGVEAQLDAFDDRLQAIAFGKQYLQLLHTVEGDAGAPIRDISRTSHYPGAGALLRYRVTEWLLAKASYEWATRLPVADEIFGDNVETLPNSTLAPERSHNVNLGVSLRADEAGFGSWSLSLAGFLRDLDDMILLMPASFSRRWIYRNLYETRATGLVADVEWTSPGDYRVATGNLTRQEHFATSTDGPFGYLAGKNLPNRPTTFANAQLRLQFSDVMRPQDRVFSSQYLSWVDAFYRGWEASEPRSTSRRSHPSSPG